MRTETEIREYRDALKRAIAKPCDCPGTLHETKCKQGGLFMELAADVLAWVLGEPTRHSGLVAKIVEGNP